MLPIQMSTVLSLDLKIHQIHRHTSLYRPTKKLVSSKVCSLGIYFMRLLRMEICNF